MEDQLAETVKTEGQPHTHQLPDTVETEGQPHTQVKKRGDGQPPPRNEQNNSGNARGNIQADEVNIFYGNDPLKSIAARTSTNLERACPQGYVRTRSYYRALSVVTKQGTCILTGSSGSGKTTLARHLLLHFRDQGFEPLELISPGEYKCLPWNKVGDEKCKQKIGDEKYKQKVGDEKYKQKVGDEKCKQKVGEDKYKLVLLVDNVLGAGNYEDELRRKWGIRLEAMRPYIDQGHVKVILASRANIYAQIREVKGSRELLQEAPEVAVGGGDCQLTDWEKTGILERVLAFHKVKLPTQVSTKKFGILACKETAKLGYPQMCVYLATNKNALSDPVAFVQNPVQFLNDEFSQLRLNDLTSYYILILALLREGELTEHFLKDESSEAFLSRVAKMVGLSQAPGFGQIQKMANHLCYSYLEYNSQTKCFSFSHDSIWDSLFTHLCKSDFDRAVQVCTWKQLLLYVRTDPKSKNKEDFVYLVPETDWPILAKRLLRELTCGNADLACSHPCLQHLDFVRWLMEESLTSESIGSLLKSMHKLEWVVTQCAKFDQRGKSSFSDLTSSYKVNIFSFQFLVSSLLLRRCSSLAKHILEIAQFQTLSPPTQSQILTEALACALYVSDSGLVDWLLHRGARVTEECVRAACCAEQEHVGLVERALQWEGVLSAGMLTEMARVASQSDRPGTLELVLSHLPRSESTQAELDRILADLIRITHPREWRCRKLSQLAHMVRALKKAGAQFRPHVDQFTAAGHFDPSALSEWLEQKVDLSATDRKGYIVLHHAAECGALRNVQALLGCMDSMSQRDQLVNARNGNEDTALHLAAEGGHLAVVDVLLKNGGNANLINEYDETALRLLASCEKWNVEGWTFSPCAKGVPSSFSSGQQVAKSDSTVKEMLRKLSLKTHGLIHGDSVLHQASKNGHTVLVEVLVENRADVNSRDYGHKTPVHYAAERGHVGVLEVLCAKRAQLDARDGQGQSALHLAAEEGHLSVVEMLMENKANVDAQDVSQRTPLHVASEGGHVKIVRRLLDKGASVNAADKDGWQPLHLAASEGHFPVVECLLDGGPCVNAKDRCSTTPIHLDAVHTSIMELLLTQKASVDAKNREGTTPLHLASSKGHTSTVELLLTHKASVDKQNFQGKTALHLALEKGKWDTAELLINRGADRAVTTKNGDTMLHSMAASNSEAYTWLYRHAIAPDFSLVESLGDLADCKNNEGDTPIMVAVKRQNWEVLFEMLKLQCDLSVTDREGNTAMHLAVMQAKEFAFLIDEIHLKTKSECVLMMVEKCAKHLNTQNRERDTPLLLAARTCNTFALEEILKCHLDLDLTVRGKGGNTIFHEVVGNISDEWCAPADESVRQMLESLVGRCAELVNCPNDDGDTPILIAARKGRWFLLSLLLKQKCDVRTCDKRGNILLHYLAKYTPPEELENRARAVVGDLAETVDSANEDGNTALMLAAGSGNVWMVRELLKLQCNVRLINKRGETALYLAAERGLFSVMEMLLSQDADVSTQTKEGNTVYHALAACRGLEYESRENEPVREVVKTLVEKGRSLAKSLNSSGETPLHIAINNRNFLVMEMLLGQDIDVSTQTKKGSTVLHALAACRGLEHESSKNEAVREKVRSLVEKGRPMVNCPNSSGKTPLYIAFKNRNFLVMEMLLGQDADVSTQTKEGNTVLHALAACRDLQHECRDNEAVREVVKSVVEIGRSVFNCPNSSGETPLHIAIEEGNFLVLEMLLGQDADVSTQTKEGNTVLHSLAACRGLEHECRENEAVREKVMSLIEKCRSVINHPNSSGETPVYIAIKNRNFLMMEILLGQDADVSTQTKEGNTVLHALAACWGLEIVCRFSEIDREKVRSLVEKYRNMVNCSNSSGKTPLYISITMSNFLVVELLLCLGADVSIQTKEGNTVLHALAACEDLEDKYNGNEVVREVVRSVVEKCGSVINRPNSSGETPLCWAFLHGNWHVAELLLEQVGSSADSREGGLTDKPQETTGLSLAQGGANTPLHGLAASRDLQWEWERDEALREKVAEWVKRFSHWVNHQDLKGDTPILIALRGGNLCVAEQLLQCGADLSVTDADGGTVLHALAQSVGLQWKWESNKTLRENVAVWLKRFSHWVNHQDLKGDTPILIALREGNLCVAEQLLQCGADLSVTDADGGTVLHALAQTVGSYHEPKLTVANKAVADRVTELAQAAGVTPLTPNKKGKTALDVLQRQKDCTDDDIGSATESDADSDTESDADSDSDSSIDTMFGYAH